MRLSLNSNQVEKILKYGKKYTHNGISIVCIKRYSSEKQKSAIIISKKIVKNSTKRNRVRRVIREMIKSLKISCDEFVVMHTKKEKTEKEIREDLIQVVNKIK